MQVSRASSLFVSAFKWLKIPDHSQRQEWPAWLHCNAHDFCSSVSSARSIYKANHICFGCYQSIEDEKEIIAPIYEELIAGQLGFLGFFTCTCTVCGLNNILMLFIFNAQERKRLMKKDMSNPWGFLLHFVFWFAMLHLCYHTPPGCSGCAVPSKMPFKWSRGAVSEKLGCGCPHLRARMAEA